MLTFYLCVCVCAFQETQHTTHTKGRTRSEVARAGSKQLTLRFLGLTHNPNPPLTRVNPPGGLTPEGGITPEGGLTLRINLERTLWFQVCQSLSRTANSELDAAANRLAEEWADKTVLPQTL